MDSQFKFGADASIAIATIGAGVEGATTADLGADIVVAAKTRGLFAGHLPPGQPYDDADRRGTGPITAATSRLARS